MFLKCTNIDGNRENKLKVLVNLSDIMMIFKQDGITCLITADSRIRINESFDDVMEAISSRDEVITCEPTST